MSRSTDRPAEAGIKPSADSVDDWHDNALAETFIGLFQTEVINRGAGSNLKAAETAKLAWVD